MSQDGVRIMTVRTEINQLCPSCGTRSMTAQYISGEFHDGTKYDERLLQTYCDGPHTPKESIE